MRPPAPSWIHVLLPFSAAAADVYYNVAQQRSRAAVIHFQVQTAAVQSHFNTNCLRSHKGACARQLTPPVPALQCHVSSGTHKIASFSPSFGTSKIHPSNRALFPGRLVLIAFLYPSGKKERNKPNSTMMWKLLLVCTLAVASRAEITEEDDVLVLKKSNFDEALQAHPNILVEFCK